MHAEIIAINKAYANIGEKSLDQYNIYITLEPCLFCMNAILMSKIKKIFFATIRNKKYNFIENTQNLEIYEGILENQAKNLIKKFFTTLRTNKN
jgi:tRNA(adenine34) deaminase